jgi:hypothetical protein
LPSIQQRMFRVRVQGSKDSWALGNEGTRAWIVTVLSRSVLLVVLYSALSILLLVLPGLYGKGADGCAKHCVISVCFEIAEDPALAAIPRCAGRALSR